MLLPVQGRNIAYDLVGADNAPTVCITHSLASDGGSWAEQVPALLQAGFRVLRIDMRGHGGSDPVAGDYTMRALADDVAHVLGALAIARIHYIGLSIGGMIGQAFAIEHGTKLISALWTPRWSAGSPMRSSRRSRVGGSRSATPSRQPHRPVISGVRQSDHEFRLHGPSSQRSASNTGGVRCR